MQLITGANLLAMARPYCIMEFLKTRRRYELESIGIQSNNWRNETVDHQGRQTEITKQIFFKKTSEEGETMLMTEYTIAIHYCMH
jgi:hypothetical protein